MNALAAGLLIIVGLAHSVLGERYILIRLFRKPLPKLFGSDAFTRTTLRFAWHVTTIAWWGFAAILLNDVRDVGLIIGLTFLATGLIALVASRGKHLSWIAFLGTAALLLWPRESVVEQVEARVWEFHAADTSRSSQGVLDLLWPEFEMLADGNRLTYQDVATGSPSFMESLSLFHTVWEDVRVLRVGQHVVVSSFIFSDSLRFKDGRVTKARGPNTFVWTRRAGEWRVLHGDADHYPVTDQQPDS